MIMSSAVGTSEDISFDSPTEDVSFVEVNIWDKRRWPFEPPFFIALQKNGRPHIHFTEFASSGRSSKIPCVIILNRSGVAKYSRYERYGYKVPIRFIQLKSDGVALRHRLGLDSRIRPAKRRA